jgi:hypothetical protein
MTSNAANNQIVWKATIERIERDSSCGVGDCPCPDHRHVDTWTFYPKALEVVDAGGHMYRIEGEMLAIVLGHNEV